MTTNQENEKKNNLIFVMSKKILEVIVTNKQEALLAEEGGADRLELISGFEFGGLTPDSNVIKDVCDNVSIPVNIMIRPHANSFVYNELEIKKILILIKWIKEETKANGIIFGCLNN